MALEGQDYLFEVSKRVQEYDFVRAKVTEYCVDNKITDLQLTTQLLCMGFLHRAQRRNETLTINDVDVLLGVDDDSEYGVESLELEEDLQELTLQEILDWTYDDWLSSKK